MKNSFCFALTGLLACRLFSLSAAQAPDRWFSCALWGREDICIEQGCVWSGGSCVTSAFNIEIVHMGETPTDSKLLVALEWAKSRWEAIIVGDLPDWTLSDFLRFGYSPPDDWFFGAFSVNYTEPIDDLVIGYSVGVIVDEDGNRIPDVLGTGGCRFRSFADPNRCLSGVLRFDKETMDTYAFEDIQAIVLHEIGHVLGLVKNEACMSECNFDEPSEYTCQIAADEYNALSLTPTPLLVEKMNRRTRRCAHWAEESFNHPVSDEVMTPSFDRTKFQPISRVSVGALDDLGVYTLDYAQADPWPFTGDGRRAQEGGGWEVLQTKTSFYIPDLMIDLPLVTYTAAPTMAPTYTAAPTVAPTYTAAPTVAPTYTAAPTMAPTYTAAPTMAPTYTAAPTMAPTYTAAPTMAPTYCFTCV